VSRALLLVLASSFAGLTSFYLLLSVVPVYAARSGAGGLGAGVATGALFFATTLTELATPRLAAAFGNRLVFGAGLLLLGGPALGFGATTGLAAIALLCVLRGIGLALVVVVGSALVAALVPAERRGEGLGLYGVIAGAPAIFALPLGLWLTAHAGYRPTFAVGAVSALLGLVVLPGEPPRTDLEPAGVVAALRSPALLIPSLVFLTTALAAGAVITFVPLAVPRALEGFAALALLSFAVASTVTRWWAGRFTDRRPTVDLLRPGVLLACLGMALLFFVEQRLALVTATFLVGAGFGIAQNASLTLMFEAVPRSEYDSVSAVWNLAYDAGLGAGGAGLGVLAAWTGYPAGFALTAGLILAAVAVAWRSRHLVPGGVASGRAPRDAARGNIGVSPSSGGAA
jgi:predicted MFS family arabinose efflux permease